MTRPTALDTLGPLGPLAPLWQRFWHAQQLGDGQALDAVQARVAQRVREDGASYNAHASSAVTGPPLTHPWPLAPLPLLIDVHEWHALARGIRQRARLLEAVLADVYATRPGQAPRLLQEGLLPAQLVLDHPQHLHPVHGARPLGGQHLHLLAFDLARDPAGHWRVLGQRSQAPSGLGYALQNRLLCAEQFPDAFRALAVQRIGGAFQAFLHGLLRSAQACCAHGESPRLALLTPGAHNETHFEHAFLARYLGLSLVEGADLTVRGGRLYRKTLQGLERLHGLLRRVDDEYLDPLELRPDSQLGVPGLLDAWRQGQVLLANGPGAGWLESPGLAAFWPGVAEALLGETLQLPAADGWWCGEPSVWSHWASDLQRFVLVPTFPDGFQAPARGFPPFPLDRLDPDALAQWRARIDADPTAFTLKAQHPSAAQPLWQQGQLETRAAVVRVYALHDGQGGWSVLPGGLTRIAQHAHTPASDALLTLQAGCASCDTWVLTEGPDAVDPTSLLPAVPASQPRSNPTPSGDQPATGAGRSMGGGGGGSIGGSSGNSPSGSSVGSRVAENLFWLGRYAERAEQTGRLALSLLHPNTTDPLAPLDPGWLGLAATQGLLPAGWTPPAVNGLGTGPGAGPGTEPDSDPEAPLRAALPLLRARLVDAEQGHSVAFNLRQIGRCALAVRERLSTDTWRLLHALEDDFLARCTAAGAGGDTVALAQLDRDLTAVSGALADRMTRDDGWRLLSVGRCIERLHGLAGVLAQGLGTSTSANATTEAQRRTASDRERLLALFDSTITFRARYPGRRDRVALLQLLALDPDNPRALQHVAEVLDGRLRKLAQHDPAWLAEVAPLLPRPQRDLTADMPAVALRQQLARDQRALLSLSARIGQRFFAHVNAQEHRLWA